MVQDRSLATIEAIEDALGAPFCRGEGYLVYCLDCVDGIARMPSECIDLTVTSPPYNIGKEYELVRPLEEYLAWSSQWMQLVHGVTRPHGAFWVNLGYVAVSGRGHAVPLPYLLWDRVPFYIMQEVVWNYGAGVAARKRLSPRNEKLLWCVKDEDDYTFNLDEIRDPDVKYRHQTKNGKLRCNSIGKNPSDVWQIAKVTSGTDRSSSERAPHPAQFPLDLLDRVVRGFSNPGELVMDPFMGSGSVAECCLRNKRAVLGFEIREDYCLYIQQRLRRTEQELRQRLLDI